jgi:hypothetical protein
MHEIVRHTNAEADVGNVGAIECIEQNASYASRALIARGREAKTCG